MPLYIGIPLAIVLWLLCVCALGFATMLFFEIKDKRTLYKDTLDKAVKRELERINKGQSASKTD